MNLTFPGVPPQHSKDFFISFLSDFYAGICSNLITTLILGLLATLVVKQIRTIAEKRTELREAEKEINIFKQELLRISLNHYEANISEGNPRQAIPDEILTMIDYLYPKPLQKWYQLLKDERFFIETLESLIETHKQFISSANSFAIELNKEVRISNHARRSLRDRGDCIYILGRVGRSHEETEFETTRYYGGGVDSSLYEQITSQLSLKESIVKYQKARNQLLEDFEKIKKMLNRKKLT
jgi:hypothetical protein